MPAAGHEPTFATGSLQVSDNGAMGSLNTEREYLSHVTLLVLGSDLDPRCVSRILGLRPTQAWSKGDAKTSPGGTMMSKSMHSWGGWKKSLPASYLAVSLSGQLGFWGRTLKQKAPALLQLSGSGYLCALSCFVSTSVTASITIPAELQRKIASLGLELELSIFATPED
jgi:hypothetical protein